MDLYCRQDSRGLTPNSDVVLETEMWRLGETYGRRHGVARSIVKQGRQHLIEDITCPRPARALNTRFVVR